MARKKMSTSIRQSAKKVTKVPTRGIARKSESVAYYGVQPTRGTETYQMYLLKFFNWANIMYDFPTLKDIFITYAKSQGYNTSIIQSLPAYQFGTLGKLSHLLQDGAKDEYLDDKFDEELFRLIDLISVEIKEEKPITEEKEADKATVDYWNLYSQIDRSIELNLVDTETVTKLFTDGKPNIKTVRMIQSHYKENHQDWLKETGDRAYKRIVQKNLKSHVEIIKQIDSYLINLENTKSADRKPRKTRTTKAKSASKLVEKLQFRKTDPQLGVSSISPESIIGAKILLVFNTKTRKFGIFQSLKETGLTVKGTTVIDFDESKSVTKTLRKPADQIPMLTGSTQKRMELVFKDIKAVSSKMKGRLSEDILLLKVFK